MLRGPKIFATLDLYLASFLFLHGIQPNLQLQGTRVVFAFAVTDELYRLSGSFNANVSIPVTDFVQAVKTLRSQMITLRNNGKRTD